jgi:hypothetical protein
MADTLLVVDAGRWIRETGVSGERLTGIIENTGTASAPHWPNDRCRLLRWPAPDTNLHGGAGSLTWPAAVGALRKSQFGRAMAHGSPRDCSDKFLRLEPRGGPYKIACGVAKHPSAWTLTVDMYGRMNGNQGFGGGLP